LLATVRPGFAPQGVGFEITGLASIAVKKVEMDFTGAGTLQDVTAFGSRFGVTYPAAGLILPRVVVTDALDRQYVARAGFLLRSAGEADAAVRSNFTGMLEWLRAGDRARALNRVSPDMRQMYAAIFDTLTANGTLATAVSGFGKLGEANISPRMVEMLLVRDTPSGKSGFWIYTLRGIDGVWRVDGM
jgi:hypothetical protein